MLAWITNILARFFYMEDIEPIKIDQLLDTVPSNLSIKPNIIQNHNAQSISIKNQVDAL